MPRDVARRRRDPDEQVQEGPQVRAWNREVHRGRPELGVRVDDREVDLVVVRAEIDEQLVDGIEDLGRASVAAVDLVQGHDDRQLPGHRLLEDVAGLRQWPLGGIDEEENAVDHEQRSLDLTTEVGVSGRVHDVEANPVVIDGRLLGQDRDALLALEVHGVHDPIHDRLVRPEGARLPQHRVHERGLAVVHVGDDRHVAEVVTDHVLGRLDVLGHGDGAGQRGADGIGHGAGIVAHGRTRPGGSHPGRPSAWAHVGPRGGQSGC